MSENSVHYFTRGCCTFIMEGWEGREECVCGRRKKESAEGYSTEHSFQVVLIFSGVLSIIAQHESPGLNCLSAVLGRISNLTSRLQYMSWEERMMSRKCNMFALHCFGPNSVFAWQGQAVVLTASLWRMWLLLVHFLLKFLSPILWCMAFCYSVMEVLLVWGSLPIQRTHISF